MDEKLIKYIGLLPLTAIIVYIFGYISFSAYLQSFGINENIGLDLRIIKIGMLFSIVIIPVVLLSFSTFKIGDYSKVVPDVSDEVINALHEALGYTIMYSLALNGLLFKYSFDLSTCLMLSFLIIAFVFNKIKIHNKYLTLLKGTFLFVPTFALLFSISF